MEDFYHKKKLISVVGGSDEILSVCRVRLNRNLTVHQAILQDLVTSLVYGVNTGMESDGTFGVF